MNVCVCVCVVSLHSTCVCVLYPNIQGNHEIAQACPAALPQVLQGAASHILLKFELTVASVALGRPAREHYPYTTQMQRHEEGEKDEQSYNQLLHHC